MREHSSGAEELITDSEDCEEDFFTEHNMVLGHTYKDYTQCHLVLSCNEIALMKSIFHIRQLQQEFGSPLLWPN